MLRYVEKGMRIRHVRRPGTIIEVHPNMIRVQFDEGDFVGAGRRFYYDNYDYSDPRHTWWKHEEDPFVPEEEV